MLRVVDSASVSQDICKGVPQPSRSGDIVRAVIVLSVIAFRVIMLRLCSRPLVTVGSLPLLEYRAIHVVSRRVRLYSWSGN
jgi:hypothetical protein